jgi:AAA domain
VSQPDVSAADEQELLDRFWAESKPAGFDMNEKWFESPLATSPRDLAPTSPPEPVSSSIVAVPLAHVRMRSIEWLEKPLWQRSAFQLLAGAKGTGKGTYLAGLAARMSRAGENVLFVSTEDSTEIDLKPRLVAAGADIDRCYVIQQHVQLPDDVENLRRLALSLGGVGLFVIDPVANHIGDSNSNSDAEVRHAIAPLNRLADELGCLLIGVRHPGKDRSRGAVASILGSTAWVDTPRAVVFIAVDDEDSLIRHIQVVAGNRSLNGAAQAFRIEAVTVEGLTEPITLAVPLGESAKSVDDLLLGREAQRVPAEQLREIVLRELEQGERTRQQLDDVCKAETGANPDSVYKSALATLKNEGRIRPRKDGTTGGWFWRLDLSEQLG